MLKTKEGEKVARRKKPSRKYTTRNEFRYNNSSEAGGHPQYVFGEKNGRYLSLGITSHPKKEYPYYPLSKSPNPKETRPNYIQKKPFKTKKKFFGKILSSWKFTSDDMHTVRHITKKYKKKHK